MFILHDKRYTDKSSIILKVNKATGERVPSDFSKKKRVETHQILGVFKKISKLP